jgi:nucleoside-diphosphate-sugar epimerase
VFVTGGSGFIGSRLSERLLRDGHRVTVLTRNRHRPSVAHLESLGAGVVEGDVTRMVDLAPEPPDADGVDIVLHCAANLSLWGQEVGTVNVEGTRQVLRWAEQGRARYVVFASSVEAQGLGTAAEVPLGEQDPCAPASVYGESKLAGERLTEELAARGVPCLVARIGHTYGPGGFGFVHPFLRALLVNDGLAAVLPFVAERLMQPIFVDDVVEALVRMLRCEVTGTYNVTGADPVTVGEWFVALGDILGVAEVARARLAPGPHPDIDVLKPYGPLGRVPEAAYFLLGQGGRIHRAYADAKLRLAIGDYQRYGLYRGLAATLGWYQATGAVEALARCAAPGG